MRREELRNISRFLLKNLNFLKKKKDGQDVVQVNIPPWDLEILKNVILKMQSLSSVYSAFKYRTVNSCKLFYS